MRHHLAGILYQEDEELVSNRHKVHFGVFYEYLTLRQIDFQIADAEHGLLFFGTQVSRMPQGDPQAREQLLDAEGFGQIVVGAGIERVDLVLLAAARREHDDGNAAPAADSAHHFDAVDIGKAKVEQNDVGAARGRLHRAVGARRGLEEAIAVGGERHPQEVSHLRLVLDQKKKRALHQTGSLTPVEGASSSETTGAGGTPSTGNVKTNLAPPPSRLPATSRPPWATAMARAMARPRPAPEGPFSCWPR